MVRYWSNNERNYICMSQEIDSTVPVPTPTEAQSDTQLPGVLDLFSEGWEYVQKNLQLVGILAAPFVLMEIINYSISFLPATTASDAQMISGLLSLVALVAYVLFVSSALYMVTHQSSRAVGFAEGFAWAQKNIVSIVWIGILTGCIVMGGFALLIVPGVIIAVYLALSQIIFAAEGKTGLAALMRSRELIYGQWLGVFGRFFGVQLLYFVCIVLIGLAIGLGVSLFVSEAIATFVTDVLFVVLGAGGTLIFLTASVRMYTVLFARAQVNGHQAPTAETRYKLVGWFGLIVPFLLAVLLGLAVENLEGLQQAAEVSAVNATLNAATFEAEKYYVDQPEMSYSGVCQVIQPYFTEADTVVCNDSMQAYALAVEQQDTAWCIDSTGYNKLFYTDLGQRTQCLSI